MEKNGARQVLDMYKGIFLVAAIVALVALCFALRDVFAAVTIAIVLFYILDPIANFFTDKKLGRFVVNRVVGSALAFIIGVAAITVFITMMITPTMEQVDRFAKNMPEYIKRVDSTIENIEKKYDVLKVPPVVESSISSSMKKVTDESAGLLQHAAKGVALFLNQVVLLFMIPFLTFYLMVEKRDVKKAAVHFFPLAWQREIHEIVSESSQALRKYIEGQLLLSVIMGVGMTVALGFMGLKAPLLLGLIAGVTKLIPVIGIVLGCVPAALVALSISLKSALWVVAIFTIIQLLENKIILPLMMSKYVNISPLAILCSLMVGEQVGGVLGMFVATPLVAVLKVVYTHLREKYD